VFTTQNVLIRFQDLCLYSVLRVLLHASRNATILMRTSLTVLYSAGHGAVGQLVTGMAVGGGDSGQRRQGDGLSRSDGGPRVVTGWLTDAAQVSKAQQLTKDPWSLRCRRCLVAAAGLLCTRSRLRTTAHHRCCAALSGHQGLCGCSQRDTTVVQVRTFCMQCIVKLLQCICGNVCTGETLPCIALRL
jgi:hypothetical protein